MQPAVYLNYAQDEFITSMTDGTVRRYLVTPKKLWGLALNLEAITGGLRIANITSNTKVELLWQWSLDGVNWQDGSKILLDKTANGDYVGTLTIASVPNELIAFGRVLATIVTTTESSTKSALISAWGYYKFRT